MLVFYLRRQFSLESGLHRVTARGHGRQVVSGNRDGGNDRNLDLAEFGLK